MTSPLDAAKALAVYTSRQPRMICMTCHQLFAEGERGHAPDCPWLAMPQIVAALERLEAWEDAENRRHAAFEQYQRREYEDIRRELGLPQTP